MKHLLAVLLTLFSLSALADESRIRFEEYDAYKVYTIYASIGKATVIQLQEGETIDPAKTDSSALGIGFGSAWTLGVHGSTFVLKPNMQFPETNMLIVTNRRTYAIDLKMAKKKANTTYILSFTYPEDERRAEAQRKAIAMQLAARAAAAQAEKDRITATARAQRVVINTDYGWRGDNALLKPTAVWDDGRFTHLEYDHAGELPVFYKVLPDGSEAQINKNINPVAGAETVLQEVTRTIRARLGNDVIEIVNNHYIMPQFNATGTSEHGAVRIDKAAEVKNVQ